MMRRQGALMIAALSALLTGACAGAGEQGEPGDGMTGDQLVASVEAKVTDSSVRFILHVTNTGDTPLELTFTSSQRYDFVVETRSGEEVWKWSDDMMFLQALSQDTLGADDSWDMEATWDPAGHAGEFVVTGVLTAREHELRQSTAFELP